MDAPIGHGAAGVIPEIAKGGEAGAEVRMGGILTPHRLRLNATFGAGPSHMSQSRSLADRPSSGLP